MGVYWITVVVFLLYLVLVWFLGTLLHLKAPDIWILRGALALIGVIAAISFIWFWRRSKAGQADQTEDPGGGTEDINLLVHDALRALRNSTLGRGATMRNLPLLFLVGESGSAKTHVIIHSGLDPELLAGQVYQDNNILATRLANIWYSQPALLVDPAGNLLTQPNRWKRLVQLVRPSRASSALSKGEQAPRAAVVCFDCAAFLKPGAGDATTSAARKLGARIHEISQTLSISLPIYVLFTKLDRLPGFTEFARALTPDEAAQVLGATMPMRSATGGVYAEEETKRLTAAFDELFYSLADKRVELLSRENEKEALAALYEFPRELRKLRTLIVQFLLELARPSQLSVNPFLRGFYFSGVRPVFVEDGVSAAPQVSAPAAALDGGATQIFSARSAQPISAAAVRSSGPRKIPHWAFLARLFNDVIVKDRVALATSGFSSKVNLIRRIGLITAAVLAIVFIVGFISSFVSNRQLENNVTAAASNVQSLRLTEHQLPAYADLERLERLRQELRTLHDYQTDGVPLHLRWGLYVGADIAPSARKVYFQAFRRLLFDDAQSAILGRLRRLPDQPTPEDKFETSYGDLKGYLITAGFHQYSSREFPSSVLASRWSEAKSPASDVKDLAARQFEFYSAELQSEDPYRIAQDEPAVRHARAYLAKFGGIDRYYQPLIEQASQSIPDANFARKFPNAAGLVFTNPNRVVRAAFTPAGYEKFKAAVNDPGRALVAEKWVLDESTAGSLDQATLRQRLLQKYEDDYIAEWETVLRGATVASYHDLNDAGAKLERLLAADSPLLEMLWFVSSNTVAGDKLKSTFASVQGLQPPGDPQKQPEILKQSSNNDYMQALAALRTNIVTLSQSPTGTGDAALVSQANLAAAAAKNAAIQAAGARLDPTYQTPQSLERFLEQPITSAERLLLNSPKDALNGAGKGLCDQFARIASKFPFNPRAPRGQEVTLEEFNGFFAPHTGALWALYESNKLSQYMQKEGARYRATSTGTVKINPGFLESFSRMAAVTDAFYASGSPVPNFAYSLTVLPNNVRGLSLSVGSEKLEGVGQQKKFTWTGAPEDIRITAADGVGLGSYSGPWAVFRFVFTVAEGSNSRTTLRRNIMQSDGSAVTVDGKQEFYAYQLQAGSPSPFDLLGSAGLRCDPHVAH